MVPQQENLFQPTFFQNILKSTNTAKKKFKKKGHPTAPQPPSEKGHLTQFLAEVCTSRSSWKLFAFGELI